MFDFEVNNNVSIDISCFILSQPKKIFVTLGFSYISYAKEEVEFSFRLFCLKPNTPWGRLTIGFLTRECGFNMEQHIGQL